MNNSTIVTALFCRNEYYFLMSNNSLYCNRGIIQTNIIDARVIDNKIYVTNFNRDCFELMTDNPLHLQYRLTSLPFEILDMICDYLDFTSQINFRLVSKRFSQLHLTNFWDANKSFAITNQIIENNPFMKKLDLSCNWNVVGVGNLVHLKKLNIVGSRVKTVSNCPNLEICMLNSDDVKLPDDNKLRIVRFSKFASIYSHYDENLYERMCLMPICYDFGSLVGPIDEFTWSERREYSSSLNECLVKPAEKINFKSSDRYHSTLHDKKKRYQKNQSSQKRILKHI